MKKRTNRIPIPRDVMSYFRKMADTKTAMDQLLRGYRRAFRQRVAAGESPAMVHASVKEWLKRQDWSK